MRGEEDFRPRVEKQAGDVAARISWAKSCLLEGDYTTAESVLRDGLASSRDARLCEALADLYVTMAERLGPDRDATLADRLALWQKALDQVPTHAPTLNRMALLIGSSRQRAASSRVALQDLLAAGELPGVIHLVLGSAAAAEARWAEARVHLEQARREYPQLPALLGQLAWALCQGDPPDPEAALRLADEAVQADAECGELLAIRGQILAKLKRWPDALRDLERAVGQLPDRSDLHEALAEAYTALGNDEMAKRHRDFLRQKP